MDLGNGLTTPGYPWHELWDNTRLVRANVDYRGKAVLDLGSWDGMWAFEAEAIGASVVVATDCLNYWQVPWHQGMNNLMLVREALFSGVIPLWNVCPTRLRDRLDGILFSHAALKDGFDIVQHLGLLYHLRDPLFSLAQTRAVLRDGGVLVLETAVHAKDENCTMHFNAGGKAIYDDFTTWWAPTLPCLREMLRTSLFVVEEERILPSGDPANPFARVTLRARALAPQPTILDRYLVDPSLGHGFGEHLMPRIAHQPGAAMEDMQRFYEERYGKRE